MQSPALSFIQDNPHHDTREKKQSIEEVCSPQNFLVLIKGGAKAIYQRRREIWRESKCPATYKEHKMMYHFMLGMPAHEVINPNSHNQGARASEKEISDMEQIRNESLMNRDIIFLSLKDVYDNFNLKTMRMFEWAVDRGMTEETSMVVFHDDEYCLRPEVLQTICEKTFRSNSSLYAGSVYWRHPSYDIQKGFDGSFAPYFGGWLYALSSDLVKEIAYHEGTTFASMNLGFSEDLQVGKWVKN
ncbi:hypothetical protein ACHAWF_012783, partial [Thalassiosira exigua]